ncbi:hypothetical protein Syn33_026 [Prochlorococcus phage Syn33]|uniref:Uncharacterized protein n=1 Tax=Prochlorococcus phage Syn33 TaxID=444878 RepID=E3SQR5_9CAUD|nr:hypothetical protein Syn33_026 [Prochlorococcus phage Syn33]ADO99755.1 hypothetical protein Syn33_026 [Prochlorococcus phage Syn33]
MGVQVPPLLYTWGEYKRSACRSSAPNQRLRSSVVEQGFCKAQVASSNLVRGSQSPVAQSGRARNC